MRFERSLKDVIGHSSEPGYFILFIIYISYFFVYTINWVEPLSGLAPSVLIFWRFFVVGCAAIYLFITISDGFKLWKKTATMLGVGVLIGGCGFLFGSFMSEDAFNWGMDIYLCLMAYGKNYKRILRCVLIAALVTLIVAGAGIPLGFTNEREKPENVSPGMSFGITYPNTWGYLAFLAMLVFWYLYLQKQPIVTAIVFWAMTAFMYFVVSCRTIALLSALFPLAAIFVWWINKRTVEITEDRKMDWRGIMLTAVPVLCFLITVILALNMKWVHKTFYHTALESMSMRFVQTGICYQRYGFPLIGHDIMTNGSIVSIINGEQEYLYVMDSSYGSYSIMRGMIWMALCLAWLTNSMWKAWKNRDNALISCGIFLCIFAIMERPGLDLWYNFLLAYPLAAIGAPEKLNWKFWEKKKIP